VTHEDAGRYARKHGKGAVMDPMIQGALLKRAPHGTLSCAIAFDVAKLVGVPPEAVGRTADLMELRLVKCQLGLFGYRPKKSIVKPPASVGPALKKAISEAIVGDRLACEHAWEVAQTLGIHKMKVSAACDYMKIKIRPCQLGAF
jgi:hypothetical protein